MPFSILSPTIHEQEKFTWRGITRRDLPEIWELLQVVNRVDDNDYYEAIEDLERQYDDPRSNPKTDARVIRNLAGKLAAYLRISSNPEPEQEIVAYTVCEIAPEARAQGLEEECCDWIQERAAERLAEIAEANEVGALPRLIRPDFPETARENIALYRARGYQHIRSSYQMQRDLREPIPEISLPPNLTLCTYTDELSEPLRDARNEAFQDHWGYQVASPETWRVHYIGASDLRRDITLAVMDGAQVVAYSINYDNTADNERRGIKRGWVGNLGTRRNYRKRGLASFLLAETMRRFRADGFDFVGLDVDAENVSGALALYQGLGFKAYKTRVVLEKRVG